VSLLLKNVFNSCLKILCSAVFYTLIFKKKKDKFGVSVLAFNTRFKELEIYFVGLDNAISIEVLSPSIIKAIYNEMEELEWI
jgi:hypothetical protein